MLAYTGPLPRELEAVEIFNRSIVGKITEISDLGSCGWLEFL